MKHALNFERGLLIEKKYFFAYIGNVEIIPINLANVHIFEVFAQDYEGEFSAITQKEPDGEGRFALEADWQSTS